MYVVLGLWANNPTLIIIPSADTDFVHGTMKQCSLNMWHKYSVARFEYQYDGRKDLCADVFQHAVVGSYLYLCFIFEEDFFRFP
jgi:hypothetical protein